MSETAVKKKVRKRPDAPSVLDSYKVDPDILNKYVNRIIGGVSDFEIASSFYNRKRHVLLEGPTSSGKTFFVEALAAHLGKPLFTVGGAGGTTETDLFGRWVPTGEGDGLVWADGPVTLAVKHGGIIYVNEGNFIPPEVTSLLYSLTDFRGRVVIRGAVDKVTLPDGTIEHRELVLENHPDTWVIVDGNPGYGGTQDWNEAFRNRFSVIEWGYDLDVERELISSGALRDFIAALRQAHANGDIITPVATKQFIVFEESLYELGWDFALHSLFSYFHDTEREFVKVLFTDGFATRIAESYDLQLEEEE